jgi:predicted membrane metal-binding protein
VSETPRKKTKQIGTHERLADSEAIKTSSDRSFGLVFAAVFAIIGLWPLISGDGVRLWSLIIAAIFAALALARPTLLAPLNRLWTRFGLLLNRVVSPLVMGLLFFVVITPIALIMRATGKDLLHLKFDRKAKSYWIEREPPGPAPESIKNQF